MTAMDRIAVIGAGAWGTALAINAARAGRRVTLIGRNPEVARVMTQSRENQRYLPGVALDPAIRITTDLSDAADTDVILLVVPAQTVAAVASGLGQGSQLLVVCAKGLERRTDRRLSEVIVEVAPDRPVAVLSGPNFAREVALGLPAAATLACSDARLGPMMAASMSHETFRAYWTDDLIGVEIGGAIKNVLAIAAGMVTGKGLGENAKAALITRGLAELMRLGEALGARRGDADGPFRARRSHAHRRQFDLAQHGVRHEDRRGCRPTSPATGTGHVGRRRSDGDRRHPPGRKSSQGALPPADLRGGCGDPCR